MDDQQNFGQGQGGFSQRQMYQGNWTCAQCKATITELPFKPDGQRPVYCRDCHREMKRNQPRRRFDN